MKKKLHAALMILSYVKLGFCKKKLTNIMAQDMLFAFRSDLVMVGKN